MIKAGKRPRNWDDDAGDSDADDGVTVRPEAGSSSFIQTVLKEEELARQAQKYHKPGKLPMPELTRLTQSVSRTAVWS